MDRSRNLNDELGRLCACGIQLNGSLISYSGTEETEARVFPINTNEVLTGNERWQFEVQTGRESDRELLMEFRATLQEGRVASTCVAVEFAFSPWSTANYVLMPGGAYNGNRFEVVPSYRLSQFPGQPSAVMPVTITAQERLSVRPGRSRIDFMTGDLTTPGVAVHLARARYGFIVLTEQRTHLGNSSITVEESADRAAAWLRFSAPGMRPGKYGAVRGDKAADFQPGESVVLRFRLQLFPASNVNDLFRGFFYFRKPRAISRLHQEIPFSHCWTIQEKKYNEQNWVEDPGYYSVGMRECASQDWQTAWVGGMNTLYALLCEGEEETRMRARRTFDFLFSGGQYPSGFFREVFHRGWQKEVHPSLIRYSADALFFIMKEFRLLEARGETPIPSEWKIAARRCADAFCKLWETQGQFGHRIDPSTGVIVFGGTCCASTACGGLALAASYFKIPWYLSIAAESAEYYHREYVSRGITNGGPGDILQCPDSESCAGLLESYVTLYEQTRESRWLRYAEDAAHQCASWTMSYDFHFPAQSTFGKMQMLTTGTVFASIQNKHSAPGICTLSGNSLFKLYRATGERKYLELLRDIAHAIPQFMSRSDRPIVDRRPGQTWPILPPGWINERVNTSDWEVRGNPDADIGVGEVFGGSTWSEAAMMLTFAEVPGIYVQPDTGFVCVLDHVEAKYSFHSEGHPELQVYNPTKFPGRIKIFVENSHEMDRVLGPIALHDCPALDLPAQGCAAFSLRQDGPGR